MKMKKGLWYLAILAGMCLTVSMGRFGRKPSIAYAAEANAEEMHTLAKAGDAVAALRNGRYAVDVALSGGSGKASVMTPALMVVENGRYYAQITWSSSNYDYMVVSGETYENLSEEGRNSSFLIPILAFDEEMPVIADTLAMGEPHEISYTLFFYSDSIGSESSLPQEGAKRVLAMAAAIIVVGGILNHFSNKRRKNDYTEPKKQSS